MKKLVLIFFCLFSLAVHAQKKTKSLSYHDDHFSCKYHVRNGMLYGDYVSYHRNGKKSAEGMFVNNNRFGTWIVYDSLGNKIVERKYYNNLLMYPVFPAIPDNGPARILSQPVYLPVRDSLTHRYKTFKLEARMVVEAKRIWRIIYPENNPLLFENSLLEKTMYKAISQGMSVFSPANDEFTEVLEKFPAGDSSSRKIVAWKIKEDWFFDNERMIAENMMIGICPRIVSKNNPKDTTDLCWIYIPEFRQYLSTARTSDTSSTAEIQHLDDVFFLRHFSSTIIKESNIYNRSVADYAKTSSAYQKETQRIELSLIEHEHDLWRRFAGK